MRARMACNVGPATGCEGGVAGWLINFYVSFKLQCKVIGQMNVLQLLYENLPDAMQCEHSVVL